MRTQLLQIIFTVLIGLFLPTLVLGEDLNKGEEKNKEESKEGSKKEQELPKSGSLSSTISGVHGSRNVPGPWGGSSARTEDKAAPISGSVSKVSAREWRARIFNNSEDTYSVNLAVHQFDRNDKKIKSDSFSYTLKPGQSVDRPISALATTEQCSLDLLSWKKLNK